MSLHPGVTPPVNDRQRALRVFSEETTQPPVCDLAAHPGWRRLCRAYFEATGLLLRFIPGEQPTSPEDIPVFAVGDSANGEHEGGKIPRRPLGYLRLDVTEKSRRRYPPEENPARELAESLAGILGEFLNTRMALWEREAELAAGIPLVPHPEEQEHLAHRLQEVLRSTTAAVGCQSAALYVLDEATSHLKLRATWGLPLNRLLAPPRLLKESLADLEAMLGHAVALENATQISRWRCPESCEAAVCLPVSTPTTILGTLWVFAEKERSFSEKEIDILEVSAGRIAAELEREMALQTALQAVDMRRQWEAGQKLVRSQLPAVSPLLDRWELAGWLENDRLGGAFFDWCCCRDGRVHFAFGQMPDDSLRSALVLSSVRSAWRSHAQYQKDLARLMEQLNLTVWTGSAGDQAATLLCGTIDPAGTTVRTSTAGTVYAVLLSAKRHRMVPAGGALLGVDPESKFVAQRWLTQENSLLVIVSDAVREARDADQRPLWETQILPMLSSHLHLPAKTLVQNIQRMIEEHPSPRKNVAGVLIVKRRSQ